MSDDGGQAAMEGMEARFRGAKGDKGEPGEGITAGARRAVVYLFVLTMLLAGAGLFIGIQEINGLQREVRAQCKFDADLGTAPIALNPATNKPSLLGVTIVSDDRVAWHNAGCPGRLPPADPSFARWARYYHLPVN